MLKVMNDLHVIHFRGQFSVLSLLYLTEVLRGDFGHQVLKVWRHFWCHNSRDEGVCVQGVVDRSLCSLDRSHSKCPSMPFFVETGRLILNYTAFGSKKWSKKMEDENTVCFSGSVYPEKGDCPSPPWMPGGAPPMKQLRCFVCKPRWTGFKNDNWDIHPLKMPLTQVVVNVVVKRAPFTRAPHITLL